jgi:short-subunit dehydrogenase
VATQFQRRAGIRADLPRILVRSADDVALQAYRGLMAGQRIVVPGLGNKLLTLLLRFGPRRVLLPGNQFAMRYSSRPTAKRSAPLLRGSGGELPS